MFSRSKYVGNEKGNFMQLRIGRDDHREYRMLVIGVSIYRGSSFWDCIRNCSCLSDMAVEDALSGS